MATYTVTAPDGRTVRLTGDSPPTEAELEEVFAGLPSGRAATEVAPPYHPRLTPLMIAAAPYRGGRLPQTAEEERALEDAGAAGFKTAATMTAAVPLVAGASALAPKAVMPIAGGVEGHRLGKKLARGVGLPEEVGGVPGAIIGAIFPGASLTAGLGEHFGGAEGGLAGVALAALARRYGLASLGPLLRAAATRLPAAAVAEGGAPAAEAVAAAEAAPTLTAAERFAQVSSELKAARAAAPAPAPAVPVAAVPSAGTAAVPVVAEAAPVAAGAATGADVSAATRTAALMAFARQNGRRLGEKVWALLDESGLPVKALTPDQAAAAARRGLPVSWAIKVGP